MKKIKLLRIQNLLSFFLTYPNLTCVVCCSLDISICYSLPALFSCVSVLLFHNFTGIPKLHLLKST